MAFPTTLALITALWSGAKKTRAIALWSGIGGGISALGPLVSGFLLEHFDWGSVFLVTLPLAVVALILAIRFIPSHVNETTDPVDNLGGIFRNAVAFGADAVLLDPSCCDPLYRKTIRVSVGASLICPFARANSDTALMQAIKATSLKPVALSLRGEADIGRMAAAQSGIALLIGSEGHGLPDAVLTGSEGFRIPMAPGFDSLNAATATGIALHIAASALGKLGNG